jgi:Ca2+-dependent lipid-binding protein
MDPFLQIEHDGKTFKTKAQTEGGLNPIWNHKFQFIVYSMDDRFVFKCFDEDIITNDHIGSVVLTVE